LRILTIRSLILWALTAPLCLGAVIDIDIASEGTAVDPNEFNGWVPNILLSPHPAWRSPLVSSEIAGWEGAALNSAWISYAETGNETLPDFYQVPNGTEVVFTQLFFLPPGEYSGSVSVMADDTTQVWLNGVLLYDFAPDQPGDVACSNTPIGCVDSTVGWYIPLPPELLEEGENSLEFIVWQTGGSAFGLDYLGQVFVDDGGRHDEVPEPATWSLAAAGLAVGVMRFLRRRPFR